MVAAEITVSPPVLPPSITSFAASQSVLTNGDSAQLSPVFQNGSGSIDNGVGSVVSGNDYSVSPTTNTVYTLTVRNSEGTTATQQVEIEVVAAPTIATFAAAESTITSGDSTTITATFADGDAVIDNGIGAVTSGGSVSVSPSADTTYTLTVTNAAGTEITQQLTVTVVEPPIITSFDASLTTINSGQSTVLTAVFSDGSGSIDNGIGSVSSGAPITVSPLVDTTYTLSVTNPAGVVTTAQVAITVTNVPPPVITSFTVSDSIISVGESLALTAVFSGGTATIDNGVGPVTSGAPVSVSPGASTTYNLTVTNSVGVETTDQVTVTVVPPPNVSSFTAASSIITDGDDTTLTAVFSDGTGSINNGIGAVSSGIPVTISPTVDTAYVLTVTNTADTSVTRQVTVQVVPPPSIGGFTSNPATIPQGTERFDHADVLEWHRVNR